MQYLVIDTETSGLPAWDLPADHPSQPHVAAVAFIFANEALETEREYEALIKPDGWTMEPGAMAVNGLAMERLEAEGIPIAEALAVYAAAIDEGRAVMAHNARFDVKMMRAELRRAAMDDRFELTPNLCTMRGSADLLRIAPTDAMMATGRKSFKPPKLAEAYMHFVGKKLEGAHSALADARACLEIARCLKARGALPEPAIHYAQEGTKAHAALTERPVATSFDK